MRKTRSDSILEALPTNQRETLEMWLLEENLSYAAAAKKLFEDFNVKVAPSSLQYFYQAAQQRRMLDRIASSRTNANLVVAKFKENPADIYTALIEMAGQIAFDKAMQGGKELDPETIYNFTKLVITARKEERESRRLDLEFEKYRNLVAEQKRKIETEIGRAATTGGGLTPETLGKIKAALNLM